jgi:hypothetical protein
MHSAKGCAASNMNTLLWMYLVYAVPFKSDLSTIQYLLIMDIWPLNETFEMQMCQSHSMSICASYFKISNLYQNNGADKLI